tara:strand:- start:187 stop:357 length:171 start_codon:yes stop_codon:yes gene_type:complete
MDGFQAFGMEVAINIKQRIPASTEKTLITSRIGAGPEKRQLTGAGNKQEAADLFSG